MHILQHCATIKDVNSSVVPTQAERVFVRQFGGSARVVVYSGKDSFVGLKVLGLRKGFRIEDAGRGRCLRMLRIVGQNVVVTNDCRPLRMNEQFILKNIDIQKLVQ